MPSVTHFYILATSALICTILVPYVSRLSVHIGGLDRPGNRKIHQQATPRLGGIAVFCSLLFTIIFFSDIDQKMKGFLSGAIIIFLTGLADDLSGLTPRQKFAGEFLAAALAIVMGDIVVRHLGNPFGLGEILLGPFAVPFTLLGIVGLINAINLLDGLDGLAGGVCTIICVTFAIISFNSGNTVLLLMSVALMGSLLGFLRYNHHPAIIFMGDSGSLLLGYCMGVFSVLLVGGGIKPVSPYIPLLALGVPILDTLVVMTNRARSGKRLFVADNSHLHHRLLGLGLSHRMTVLAVFGLTYLLCILAIFGLEFSDGTLLLILLSVGVVVYGAVNYRGRTASESSFESIDESAGQISQKTRTLAHRTGLLTIFVKYLIILALVLPIFISHNDIHRVALFPPIILAISAITFFSRCTWNNVLLQGCIYVSGVFMVFILENYGREEMIFSLPLTHISHGVFILLVTFASFKALIRKRISRLMVSPFEYLIMLIVLSVPLLPQSISSQYHLLTVAAKSVVLFVAFKLILMRQLRRNRKIVLAIVLSSFVLVLRFLLDW